MALWDGIKKGAEEGLEAMKEGMAIFVAEAGKQGKIIKKRVELSSLQNSVRKTFIRLGSSLYDDYCRGEKAVLEKGEVRELITQIDQYKARVREIELEIEAIKREESSKAASAEPGKDSTPPTAQDK
jgi:DNA primase large subunit